MSKPSVRRVLTEKGVAALKPAGGKRVTVWDAVIPAFCVCVTETGSKAFLIVTRHQGHQRWVTLGHVGAISLAAARDAARDVLAKVRRGEDPGAKPAVVRRPDTFNQIAVRFVEEHAKRNNKRWRETERILKRYVLPSWGARVVTDISKRDVLELRGVIDRNHGPIQSNRARAVIRRLFVWAVELDIVTTNPVLGVKPVGKEHSRDRVLSDTELRAFWKATGSSREPWRSFFRTLALTGQRLNEVARMRWEDIDLERAVWTLPAGSNKSARVHEVPLSGPVLEILRAMPRWSGAHVFTTTAGAKAVAGFSPPKAALDAAMNLTEGWTSHDLRRSFATTAARLGVPPHVVERVLDHTSGTFRGVAGIYNRAGYDAEKRLALDAWAAHVLGLGEERPTNVVALRQ